MTCGTQQAPSPTPPAGCATCLDPRQYVRRGGQAWTTMAALAADHTNRVEELEPGLTGIGTTPSFAIGQRALLTDGVLWDCITLVDDATVGAIEARGGVHTIAISHPHFHAAMVEWADRLDARVLVHAANRAHVVRSSPRIEFWDGERAAASPAVELVRLGGHFEGGSVALWNGAMLSGDIVQVVADTDWVSFMYSYPNLIPLPPARVEAIGAALADRPFDTIHGAWWGRVVTTDGSAVVSRSVERYLRAVAEPGLPS